MTDRRSGTKITFKPDPTTFATTEYSFEILSQRLRELSYLNRGVTITIRDERRQFEQAGQANLIRGVRDRIEPNLPSPISIVRRLTTRRGIGIPILELHIADFRERPAG